MVRITSSTCSITWIAVRRSKELSAKGYGKRSRSASTSARLAGLRSMPMDPGCLWIPQPTSRMRGCGKTEEYHRPRLIGDRDLVGAVDHQDVDGRLLGFEMQT